MCTASEARRHRQIPASFMQKESRKTLRRKSEPQEAVAFNGKPEEIPIGRPMGPDTIRDQTIKMPQGIKDPNQGY